MDCRHWNTTKCSRNTKFQGFLPKNKLDSVFSIIHKSLLNMSLWNKLKRRVPSPGWLDDTRYREETSYTTLGRVPNNSISYSKYTSSTMFLTTLFVIARNLNQPRYLPMNEWKKKMWYIIKCNITQLINKS